MYIYIYNRAHHPRGAAALPRGVRAGLQGATKQSP